MSLARQTDYVTEQEYLAGEKLSDVRHEYADGVVTAMAGASKRHNRIAFNIAKAVDEVGLTAGCETFSSDVKVRLLPRKLYYYPDVVVSCADDDHEDDYYLSKPCLIVEVLSNATREKDYQEKLLAYQTIPSLQSYLIVSQEEVLVDHFYRDEIGNWWVEHFRHIEEAVLLNCPEMLLPLEQIYAEISFNG